ncbi:MAG TPA: fluoride efflux transporter CrcB [Gaiellaceae bacterium]|nr:fluoride efflux transporter CrcB [Gaiellaceae bacterium]
MPTPPKLAAHVEAHALSASVFVGGCVGTLARGGLARAFPAGNGVPWGTLIANVVGTALLAWFATRLQERLPPSTYRRPLLGTGFCGALTTFSTLQVELLRLGRDGHAALAVAYFAVSLAVGLAAMFTVTRLVRRARLR